MSGLISLLLETAASSYRPQTGKRLVSLEFTALFADYWLVLGSRTPGCLSQRLVKEPGGATVWAQSCRPLFSPLKRPQRLCSSSPWLMASICLSAAEEEQKQMRDGSADPHGDVSEDQSCLCSLSPLAMLVFLDFPPAQSGGLWRICCSPSSWRTNPLRAGA